MPRKSSATPKKAREEPKPKKENLSPVDAFVKQISADQRYKGTVQVKYASDVKTTYFLRRPTGILSLDIALGGGVHSGGTCEVFGEESAGKTHLAFRIAAEVQRIYGPETGILIFSTEMRIDKGFARRSGLIIPYSDAEIAELEQLRMAQGKPPFTAEELDDLKMEVGRVITLLAATADKGLDVILDALKAGAFQLVIIESMGAFLTSEVDEDNVGDSHYAGASKIVTQFQNKVYPLFIMDREDGSLLETTVIGVNQARALIGGSPKGPTSRAASGAFAWKHGQMVSIRISKGQAIMEDKEAIGREVHWYLNKGKAGTHDGLKGAYDYYHIRREDPVFLNKPTEHFHGVDVLRDAITCAKNYGVISSAGAWVNWGDIKAQGIDNFAAQLGQNPELVEKLWAETLNAANITVRYK